MIAIYGKSTKISFEEPFTNPKHPAEYPTLECKPDTKELHGNEFDQLFWKIRGQKHPYGVKLHAHKHLSLFILHVSII